VTAEVQSAIYAASRFRAAKRSFFALLLLAAVCGSVWYSRAKLLQDAAELWIVSDPVGPADAAVILGGGTDTRPFAVAGKAEMLFDSSHTTWNRNVLLKLGVPETAIEIFGSELSNTYQEAAALREWAVRTHARSVIVPTEAFSSRRVRWVVEHELAGTGVQVQVPALDDIDYSPSDWWKDEKGVVAFQNEVIKYVYYRLKY
jgi:uncharacterized SAM-binding protein YcdF (DUF218 family)